MSNSVPVAVICPRTLAAACYLRLRWLLLCCCVALTACAAQLAPAYDKAVVDGLSGLNLDTMQLLAAISNGAQAADFSSRQAQYINLIGRYDALALQAGARPLPRTRVNDAINGFLQKRGLPPLSDDGSLPSAGALQKISATLAKMRDTDQKQGLTAVEVQLFKGQISVFLDQAITYENYLQR